MEEWALHFVYLGEEVDAGLQFRPLMLYEISAKCFRSHDPG